MFKQKKIDKMVLFIQHEGERWIAKPDRSFGKLQLDLYDNAFKINEEMFKIQIKRKIIEDRTYVSEKTWSKVVDKIKFVNLEEIEQITNKRRESIQNLMDYITYPEPTPNKLIRTFSLYETMVSYFHFRWNFTKEVEKRLENQLAKLQPKYRLKAMKLTTNTPQVETVKSMKEFHDVIQIIQENHYYREMFLSLDGELLNETKKIPELWARITSLAEDYMHIHNEDIRLQPPYDYIINHIRKNLEQPLKPLQEKIKKTNLEEIKQEIRPYIENWDVFQKYIGLAIIQGIDRENEHHLQIRAQNKMRKKLDILANTLVDKSYLKEPNELFEIRKDDIIKLAEKVNLGKLCYDR